MQQEQYFKAVKASERLPEKEGTYYVRYTTGECEVLYASGINHEKRWKALFSEWLEPIEMPDAERLRRALEKIANPIKYLREEAEKDGGKLDGTAAIQLSKDANFLQSIAREALSAGDGWLPMESAPKDGTFILVYDKHDVNKVAWVIDSWCIANTYDEERREYLRVDNPLGWKPLPSPPIQ